MAGGDPHLERQGSRLGLGLAAMAVMVTAAVVTVAALGWPSSDQGGSARGQAITADGAEGDGAPGGPDRSPGTPTELPVATTRFGPDDDADDPDPATDRGATIAVGATSTTEPPSASSASSTPATTTPMTSITPSSTGEATGSTDPTTGSSVTTPTVTAPSTTGEPTTWTPPPDDPTQPSPAAVAADRKLRTVPAGLVDCGTAVLTSGYPTTTTPPLGLTDCIILSAQGATPAQYSHSGRNQANGMSGALYRFTTAGGAQRIDYTVDRVGAVNSITIACVGFGPGSRHAPACLAG